jgi:hypothetical protein
LHPSFAFTHQPLYEALLTYVPHVSPTSLFLIWLPEYWVSSTDPKVPSYVVFSTPPLPCPSSAQISTSASYIKCTILYFFYSDQESKHIAAENAATILLLRFRFGFW